MKQARAGTASVGPAKARWGVAAREPLVEAVPCLGPRPARRATREILEEVNAMNGTP
jgi:hypothetical protein